MNQPTMPGYFFMPRHIVLVGASERPHSLGERILTALLGSSFQGKITPVNLRHKTVAGLKAYPNPAKISESVDLVIAVTPPESYETLFKSCRKKAFHHLILIQDWDNLPPESLQTAASAIKKHHSKTLNISICTTAGIQLPTQSINAGILPEFPAGHVAVLSGHAAVSREIDLILRKMKQGISRHISLNYNLTPTTVADWLNRFGHNRHTRVAVIQHNPLENQRKLFSAIRHFARHTPVILYCLHDIDETEHAILEALSRQCNFLPAFSPQQAESALKACLSDIRPVSHLTVLSDTPIGWLCAIGKKAGIQIQMPSENQTDASENNFSTPARLRSLAVHTLQQSNTEALLAVLSPNIEEEEHATLRILQGLSQQTDIPLLISNRLAEGLLHFDTPVKALNTLQYSNTAARLHDAQNEIAPSKSGRLKNIQPQKAADAASGHDFAKLAQQLHLPEYSNSHHHPAAQLVFRRHQRYGNFIIAHYQGRSLAVLPPFTTLDSAQLIRFTAMSQHQAQIEQFICSMNVLDNQPDIFEGDIVLNIGNTNTTSFKPSETSKPHKSKKRPLPKNQTKKMSAAAEFIRSTGEAAAGLWNSKHGIPSKNFENVSAPYPADFLHQIHLNNQEIVTIRPFEPEDAEAKQQFVRNLSPQDRYNRFLTTTNELPPATLARLSKLDYYSEGAFVAENSDGLLVAVSRFSRLTRDECEFGITLAENVRGTGLAHAMMQLIIRLATQQGYTSMNAEILKENTPMLKLAEKSGFSLSPSPHDTDLLQAKRILTDQNNGSTPQPPQ